MCAAFFVASESDRMTLAAADNEAQLLRFGYTGSVENAKSSVEQDKVNILHEITENDDTEAVNLAISVLLEAGMSTPSLQVAARHGVTVKSAGIFRAASVVLGVGLWISEITWISDIRRKEYFGAGPLEIHDLIFNQGVLCSQIVIWIYIFISQTRDNRAFAARAVCRLMMVAFFFLLFISYAPWLPLDALVAQKAGAWFTSFCGFLVVMASQADVGGLGKVWRVFWGKNDRKTQNTRSGGPGYKGIIGKYIENTKNRRNYRKI